MNYLEFQEPGYPGSTNSMNRWQLEHRQSCLLFLALEGSGSNSRHASHHGALAVWRASRGLLRNDDRTLKLYAVLPERSTGTPVRCLDHVL